MHDIEPFYKWREKYVADQDPDSPFYGREYDEFKFTNKIYNYFVHPQWDDFGSPTLYGKLIYVDYEEKFAYMELIGEWNDCITNDIMYLKREVVDPILQHDINKFVFFCDNVLNFHGSDDSYYEEWYDDVKESKGYICFVNTLDHVKIEMESSRIDHYVKLGYDYNEINWRALQPKALLNFLEIKMKLETKKLH